jgi:hypothetical protein
MTKPRVGKLHYRLAKASTVSLAEPLTSKPRLRNHRKTWLLIGAIEVCQLPIKVLSYLGDKVLREQRCYQPKSASDNSKLGGKGGE